MTTREASIDHAAEAQICINFAHKSPMNDPISQTYMMQAQVHATLALVEQQRIANLIALSARGYALDDELAEVANEAQSALVYVDTTTGSQINGPDEIIRPRDDIKKGLGL